MALLTPARRRSFEYLDLPDVPPGLAERSIGDVARANVLFGGTRAVLDALGPLLRDAASGAAREARTLTLLDVGTGLADIPARAARLAGRLGLTVRTVGLDACEELLRAARARTGALVVRGDALALPFADRSVDLVTCSQLLHHFDFAEAETVLAELHRVARRGVVVSDLRRSWLAAAGLWAASFPLGFHPVSRHDGVVSVLRGFTADEIADAVRRATGVRPRVEQRLGWRVTAAWTRA